MHFLQAAHNVYQLLEDEESRFIYMNRLNYLITEDFVYLKRIIDKSVPELVEEQHKKTLNLISSLPQDHPVILYGAGSDGIEKLHYFEHDRRFIGFCDRDTNKQKNGIHGYPVISPEELVQNKNVSIVISTRRGLSSIRQFLSKNNVDQNRIFSLDECMITIDPGQYFNPDFIHYEENEIFVDAGCLNLGTSILLSKNCPNLQKVYAYEPDPQNYQQCLQNAAQLPKTIVKVFPYGTWSQKATLSFMASSDGSSRITDDGQVSIETISIDETIDPQDRVTFIKMDVEGAELESLKGARQTIQRCKPKLAICIYHKPEDMTEIPLLIKSLVPEYKLYIRHHSNSVAETVLYAVVS